jgi:outer membrane protein
MYNKYQAEQVLLSNDQRKTKEDEIMVKKKEVMEMQKTKFGLKVPYYEKTGARATNSG